MNIKKRENLIALLIMLVALGVRCLYFGTVPAGLNQDEAFAAYDAWSIMTAGLDSAGYRFPVYLSAWGSGMNALESYLMIPFFALFGTENWVVRLPQLIVALFSILAAYAVTKRTAGEKTALCFMALLAICPWHIMLSRWALESNLAPGFILFGMYFFSKGLDKSKFLLLSALMYGLALYCYATIWPILPLIILLQVIYARKKLRLDGWTLLSVLLLALLALPLLLFLAVNNGIIQEICLPFMSIPKLVEMRSGEISIQHIPENLEKLFTVLINQDDGLFWNSAGTTGILYKISLPFCLLGIAFVIYRIIKKRECSTDVFMLIQLLGALLLGALVSINVNRVNILFIPLLYFTSTGIVFLCEILGRYAKYAFICVYALLFMGFCGYYFGEFAQLAPYYFNDGLQQALEAVEDREGTVYLDGDVYHSQVLFYTKTPQQRYADTVEYKYYPSPYLSTKTFDRYVFGIDTENIDEEGYYILKKPSEVNALKDRGFTTESFGYYTLAYR